VGRIAKVLSFLRVTRRDAKVSDVKFDTGGGANGTGEHFSSPGDDSFPLTTDYVIVVDVPRSGGGVIVGYIDPINAPVALEGEKRVYARDPADGSIKASMHLKNDGSVVFSNANGSMNLAVDGTFNINGVTIDSNGNITTTGDIEGENIEGITSVTSKTVDATVSLKAGPTSSEVVAHIHVGSPTAPVGSISPVGPLI